MKKISLKFRLIFILGILCIPISLTLKQFYPIADAVFGFIQGMGIGLLLVFLTCVLKRKISKKSEEMRG